MLLAIGTGLFMGRFPWKLWYFETRFNENIIQVPRVLSTVIVVLFHAQEYFSLL